MTQRSAEFSQSTGCGPEELMALASAGTEPGAACKKALGGDQKLPPGCTPGDKVKFDSRFKAAEGKMELSLTDACKQAFKDAAEKKGKQIMADVEAKYPKECVNDKDAALIGTVLTSAKKNKKDIKSAMQSGKVATPAKPAGLSSPCAAAITRLEASAAAPGKPKDPKKALARAKKKLAAATKRAATLDKIKKKLGDKQGKKSKVLKNKVKLTKLKAGTTIEDLFIDVIPPMIDTLLKKLPSGSEAFATVSVTRRMRGRGLDLPSFDVEFTSVVPEAEAAAAEKSLGDADDLKADMVAAVKVQNPDSTIAVEVEAAVPVEASVALGVVASEDAAAQDTKAAATTEEAVAVKEVEAEAEAEAVVTPPPTEKEPVIKQANAASCIGAATSLQLAGVLAAWAGL